VRERDTAAFSGSIVRLEIRWSRFFFAHDVSFANANVKRREIADYVRM